MSITKRPSNKSIENFINSAPDGVAARPPAPQVTKTGKPGRPAKAEKPVQISIALPAELLAGVDQAAAALNISRAAFIKHALSRAVVAEQT